MTGGSITNNTATTGDGGGIYTTRANHSPTVPATAYHNLNIGEAVLFSGNTAGNGASAPPDNRLPHIAPTTASIWHYVLNNYDINYTGRLGQPPAIDSWTALRNAVNAVPANTPTTIYITANIQAPTGTEGDAIVIPANREITIRSAAGSDWTLTQLNNNQRHFIANGSLTLGENITLSGAAANNAGGVRVNTGGSFTTLGPSDFLVP